MCNTLAVQRKIALDRCRSLLATGASIEHVLGQAFDAGYLEGSDMVHLTAADHEILAVLGETDGETLALLEPQCPALVQAVRDARLAEMNYDLEHLS